jgi:hypothetical protein
MSDEMAAALETEIEVLEAAGVLGVSRRTLRRGERLRFLRRSWARGAAGTVRHALARLLRR